MRRAAREHDTGIEIPLVVIHRLDLRRQAQEEASPIGQGTFRTRVTDTYGRRYAATGERTLPIPEAAHTKPYARQGPNRVDNGLPLRSDLHRLFDRRLVAFETEGLTIQMSERNRHENSSGRVTYELPSEPLIAHRGRPDERPSRGFLEHHRTAIHRP